MCEDKTTPELAQFDRHLRALATARNWDDERIDRERHPAFLGWVHEFYPAREQEITADFDARDIEAVMEHMNFEDERERDRAAWAASAERHQQQERDAAAERDRLAAERERMAEETRQRRTALQARLDDPIWLHGEDAASDPRTRRMAKAEHQVAVPTDHRSAVATTSPR